MKSHNESLMARCTHGQLAHMTDDKWTKAKQYGGILCEAVPTRSRSFLFFLWMNGMDTWQRQHRMSCVQCIIWLWFSLVSGADFRARAHIRPRHITLRRGPALYILLRSTIMVSMWSGSCRPVILSLLSAEASAVCLHRHRKQLDKDVYMMKYLNT